MQGKPLQWHLTRCQSLCMMFCLPHSSNSSSAYQVLLQHLVTVKFIMFQGANKIIGITPTTLDEGLFDNILDIFSFLSFKKNC
jgi:hypothetical protein